MEVLNERKAKGITDELGTEALMHRLSSQDTEANTSVVKKVLGELTKAPQNGALTGYSAFAPVIDTFLKEHLFADIFERDVLTYTERELVTISVISEIGGAEPMLRSHLNICISLGLTSLQLKQFISVIKSTAAEKEANDAQTVLDEVLKNAR